MTKKKTAKKLIEYLLSLGGKHVASIDAKHGLVKVRGDPDLKLVWEKGFAVHPEIPIQVLPNARATRCHRLATQHYTDQPKTLADSIKLMTGYALSEDGIWRSHSWTVFQSFTKLCEPTPEKHLRYFGVVLSYEEATRFAEENG